MLWRSDTLIFMRSSSWLAPLPFSEAGSLLFRLLDEEDLEEEEEEEEGSAPPAVAYFTRMDPSPPDANDCM